jgi:hypothetical protein
MSVDSQKRQNDQEKGTPKGRAKPRKYKKVLRQVRREVAVAINCIQIVTKHHEFASSPQYLRGYEHQSDDNNNFLCDAVAELAAN